MDKKQKYVIYGAGKLGKLVLEIMEELKLDVCLILDKEVGVITSADVNLEIKQEAIVLVAATTHLFEEIRDELIKEGWKNIQVAYEFIYNQKHDVKNGWTVTRESLMQMPVETIVNKWEDGWSYEHYMRTIIWRSSGSFFDREISTFKWAPIITGNSIRIAGLDLPCPVEDSTLAAIRKRRIFTMYGTPQQFINIHLEGEELSSIQLSIGYFQDYRPILRVACYHTVDGLYKIEKFLMDNLRDYAFYFRCHALQGQAAYMYCIPREKMQEK